jgi:hypothetical protein
MFHYLVSDIEKCGFSLADASNAASARIITTMVFRQKPPKPTPKPSSPTFHHT